MHITSGFKLVDGKTSISHMVTLTNSGVGQVGGAHTIGGHNSMMQINLAGVINSLMGWIQTNL